MTRFVLAVVVVSCLASPATSTGAPVAQEVALPSPPSVPVLTRGTTSVLLTVVSETTGRPVVAASAIIILVAKNGTFTRTAQTDRSGRAFFGGLPPGRLRISVTHAGYLTAIHGREHASESTGTFIPIDEDQGLVAVTVRLARAVAIAGAITDEANEPIVGVAVSAYQREFVDGRVRFRIAAGAARTDDRGMYRIAGLPPGDYVVGVVPRYVESSGEIDVAPIVEDAPTDDAADERPRAAPGLGVAHERFVEFAPWSPAPPMPGDGTMVGYVPTYFPRSSSVAAASVISLATGLSRQDVNIRLEASPMVRVSGRVVSTSGAPAPQVVIALVPASSDGQVNEIDRLGSLPGPGGTFGFSFVPPGQYLLEGRGSFKNANGTFNRVWTNEPVVVGDKPIAGLEVVAQEALTVAGQLRVDGEEPPDLDELKVVSRNQAQTGMLGIVTIQASVTEDGRFTLDGVIPDRQTVTVSGLPSNWRVTSIVVDGRETIDTGVIVPARRDVRLVITISSKVGTVSGIVRDQSGQPATQGTVVVFPVDSMLWTGTTPRIVAVRPDADGGYSIAGLLPGSYAIAIADLEPGEWRVPVVLERLRARAIRVVLTPGASVTQDVKRR